MRIFLIFLTSLTVVCFSIPAIIKVAFKKRLFDAPSELRKIHKRIIPNFGGIAIFSAFLFTGSLFIPVHLLHEGNILMAAGLVMFLTGLKDDVVGLSPAIKFGAQFASAIIISLVAKLRITNLHGLFDFYELNDVSSVVLTILFIVGVVNAFNLIDGIDGLAGALGMILSIAYAYIFYKSGDFGYSHLAMALGGALMGFLFFNITPAKIFMGDSGSLFLGFMASIFSIKFLALEGERSIYFGISLLHNHMGLALAIIIIPVFDTLRVFTLRIIKNTSPFTADSNHLHHRLLFLGLSHLQATFVLSFTTLLFIILAFALDDMPEGGVLSIMALAILTINGLLSLYIEAYKKSFLDLHARAERLNKSEGRIIRKKTIHQNVLNRIFKN